MHTSRLARACNTLGYMVQMLSWAIIVVVYLPLIQESEWSTWFLPAERAAPAPSVAAHAPGIFEIIFIAIIVVAVLTLTAYALITLPRRVRQTTDRAAEHVANSALDHLAHRPMPVRTRRRLTLRLMFYIRFISALVPVLLALFAPNDILPRSVTIIITLACAIISIIFFALAYWRTSKY